MYFSYNMKKADASILASILFTIFLFLPIFTCRYFLFSYIIYGSSEKLHSPRIGVAFKCLSKGRLAYTDHECQKKDSC